MNWPLAVLLVLTIAGALIVAYLAAMKELAETKVLRNTMSEAVAKTADQLPAAMSDGLGAPVVSARMTGLAEFVHALNVVTGDDRRSGLPLGAVALAGLLMLGGTTIVVVDRIQDRHELEACVRAGFGGVSTSPPADAPATASVLTGRTAPSGAPTRPPSERTHTAAPTRDTPGFVSACSGAVRGHSTPAVPGAATPGR